MFANKVTIGDNGGVAADGSPLASAVKEGDVNGGVGFEVVGFAAFGVGVEEEVDAVVFLVKGREVG